MNRGVIEGLNVITVHVITIKRQRMQRSRPTSLANKKTLINIGEPAIYHEYRQEPNTWSEDSLMQQLPP